MPSDGPVPAEEWRVVVRNVPVVSVDLVVTDGDRVLLGERTNDPAKGEWFVPGGGVHKGERLTEAVHRIAAEELGIEVDIERRLGVYEHFYDTAEVDDAGGKHYVPVAFLVTARETEPDPDDQHAALRWFEPPLDTDLHPYVEAYLADAGLLE